MKNTDIVRQLSVGEILNKYTDNGRVLIMSELLLSDDLKVQLYFDKENNQIQMTVIDNNLAIADFSTVFNKSTLKNWIGSLKVLYGQLSEKEDEV